MRGLSHETKFFSIHSSGMRGHSPNSNMYCARKQCRKRKGGWCRGWCPGRTRQHKPSDLQLPRHDFRIHRLNPQLAFKQSVYCRRACGLKASTVNLRFWLGLGGVAASTPNRERQCIGCWLCESPTRRSHSERQCKVVQIRVLAGDAWVRTYSFQADFKAITYQSPCDAVHALVPEEWSARVSTTVLPM